MRSNAGPLQAECPSCTGCSFHGHLHKADNEEGSLHSDCIQADGSACSQASASIATEGATNNDDSLRGVRFALASLGLFLVPVSMALTGAILSMSNWGRSVWNVSDPSGQLLGATSGMLIGTLATIVAARVFQAHSREKHPLKFKSLERPKGVVP